MSCGDSSKKSSDASVKDPRFLPRFIGEPADVNGLPDKDAPAHPFLATQGTLHVDGRQTGVSDIAGPFGRNPQVTSRFFGLIGFCSPLLWDASAFGNGSGQNGPDGNVYALCASVQGLDLVGQLSALDSDTMAKRATYDVVRVPVSSLGNFESLISFGAITLDNRGRAMLANEENNADLVGVSDGSFSVEETIQIGAQVPQGRQIESVVRDHDGNYWFVDFGGLDAEGTVTESALVGCFDASSGQGANRALDDEAIENNFAIAEDGLYVVTDRALYRFTCDAGATQVGEAWRRAYDRAPEKRADTLSFGSGSAPTVLGSDWVAITDVAQPQIHLLVYRRETGDEVCKLPLFESGASANENSVVGYDRSMIVQNWAGAQGPLGDFRDLQPPGLVRVDIREDESGCDVAWSNRDIRSTNTVRLSTGSGLIYVVAQDTSVPIVDAWYLTAIDFDSGETVNQTLIGAGFFYKQLFMPGAIGPDGSFYQGVLSGIVRVRDVETQADANLPGPDALPNVCDRASVIFEQCEDSGLDSATEVLSGPCAGEVECLSNCIVENEGAACFFLGAAPDIEMAQRLGACTAQCNP